MEENSYNHDDWVEKIQKAAGITEQTFVKEVVTKEKTVAQIITDTKNVKKFFISVGIFLLALLPRLFFIFFISGTQNAGVGWYNDSYHHWQIAYLTQQIGLYQGFLRLWDLQGMEYFWGLLHPLLLASLFTVFGSADILISRLFNTVLGSLSIVVVYWILKREFHWKMALGAAILLASNPVGIFTDTSGMQEPLGIFLFLLGFLFLPKKTWLTGIVWGLAVLTRAEYWVFSVVLVGIILFDKKQHGKLGLIIPYAAIMLVYMKYLLDKTGNAIYPIYWNFLGNAAGEWEKTIPLTAQQLAIRNVFFIILLVCLGVGLYLFIKKPKLYLFSLLGIGNFMFLALFVGFSQYLKSYLPRFWVDRIFWLPYLWLTCAVACVLLYFLPKYWKTTGLAIGMFLFAIVAIVLQYVWIPITYYRTLDTTTLSHDMVFAKQVASYYKSGSVLIPGTDPIFTYALYKNDIAGAHIRGEMFGPFYYMGSKPFDNWAVQRNVVFGYMQQQQVSLLLFTKTQNNYRELVAREKMHFHYLQNIGPYSVYSVQL